MRNFGNRIGVVLGIYLFLNLASAFPQFGSPNLGRTFSGNPNPTQMLPDMTDRIDKNKKVDPYFRQNFPYWVDGMDKEGRPVYSNTIGEWDFRGKVSSKGRSEEFRDYLVSIFEDVARAIKKSSELSPNKPDNEIIAIYNWDGFDMTQLADPRAAADFLMIAKIYEKHYSKMVHALFFINCDDNISTVINLLSPVFTPESKKKLRVHKKNKEEWQKDLLQYIDADQIRPQFGGTKNDDKNPLAS